MITLSSSIRKNKDVEILVVEKDYSLALNFQDILEALEYTVIGIADSAEAAIEKANSLYPNLIFMDVKLSGEMDGIQAAAQIWNSLQIPVIYVTGYCDHNTLERAIETYPFAYIIKPFTQQELYVAIETALNRYEIEQLLSSVIQVIREGVIVVDSQLRVKYLNQVAESLTGWRLDEAKNKDLTKVMQLIDEKTQLAVQNPIILSLYQETTIEQKESILLIARNGKTISITNRASPLRNNRGIITGSVIIFNVK